MKQRANPSGYDLELRVQAVLSSELGAKALCHRMRTPFGELDLLMRLPSGETLMVEVKSLSNPQFLDKRLSLPQFRRQQRIFQWLSERRSPVLYWLIFIDPTGQLTIFDDIFG